eukprot:52466-Chlamydomonas_euryale.AAC.1
MDSIEHFHRALLWNDATQKLPTDRMGGAGRHIVDPPVDIARYAAEHNEVIDCTRARDRGHIANATS